MEIYITTAIMIMLTILIIIQEVKIRDLAEQLHELQQHRLDRKSRYEK